MEIFSFFLLGFTAIIVQIFVLREFLVVLYGNEITIGIILFSWLLSGAIGSFLFSKLSKKIKKPEFSFNVIRVILSYYIILIVFLIRKTPRFFNLTPGEISGFSIVIISSFFILFILNFLLSGLFVLGIKITGEEEKPISFVYLLESVGAFVGGVLTNFIFLKFFNIFITLSIVAILNLFATFLNSKSFIRILSLILIFPFLFLISTSKKINLYAAKFLFPDYKILDFENTRFQNVSVLKKENVYSVFTDGIYNFSYPDRYTAEMNAHLPLVSHPDPQKVLVIGGEITQTLNKILKHPIKELFYIEIDKKFVKILRNYFKFPDDKRLKILTGDVINYFNKTKKKFDIIILNTPPPHTLLLNRFYTEEFFEKVKNHLEEPGIFCFSLPSEPNYISEEQKALFLCLRETLKKVFSDLVITPGVTSYFIASNKKNVLTEDWQVFLKRLKERKIKTLYFREYYLFSEFSNERFKFLKQLLKEEKHIKINRDFYPNAYTYDIILFSTEIGSIFKEFFKKISPEIVYLLFSILILFFILLIRRNLTKKIIFVVSTTGFSEISFQIITMLIFQIIYGYIFIKITMIFTSFMFGLILGTLLIRKRIKENKISLNLLLKTQIAIFLYPVFLMLIIYIFKDYKFSFIGENLIPVLPFIPGFIGGFQFPLAANLIDEKLKDKTKSGGLTYAADLLGSCFGAIFISLIFIPTLGILYSIIILVILNFIGYIVLLRS